MFPCSSAAAFRGARARRVLIGVGNERDDLPVLDAANPDAPFPSRVIPSDRSRFGVGHVDAIAPVDEDPARAAELRPLLDEVAVAIENLNPIVVRSDEETTRSRTRRAADRDSPGPRRFCPPLDDVPSLENFGISGTP
jgi:hypothetical protein